MFTIFFGDAFSFCPVKRVDQVTFLIALYLETGRCGCIHRVDDPTT